MTPNPAQLRAIAKGLAEEANPPRRRTPGMEEHKEEYRARPLSERLSGIFVEVATQSNPSHAYKPTHGGYPE